MLICRQAGTCTKRWSYRTRCFKSCGQEPARRLLANPPLFGTYTRPTSPCAPFCVGQPVARAQMLLSCDSFLLSDGVHTLAATLSPDYHRPVFKADQNPLIRLSNYDVREVPRSGIVLIVCFEFEVVAPLYHVIGHPVKIVQSRFTPPGRVQGGTSLGRPASAEVGEGAGSRNGVGKVSRVEVEVPRCSIGALTPTVQTSAHPSIPL